MSVRGQRRHEWIIATYCDFGVFNRRSLMGRHYSERTAQKAWKSYLKWYKNNVNGYTPPVYRMWQERRGMWPSDAREIVNDTGTYGHKTCGSV